MQRRYPAAECMRAMIKMMIKAKIKININRLTQEMIKEENLKRVAKVKRKVMVRKVQVRGVVIETTVVQCRRPCCRSAAIRAVTRMATALILHLPMIEDVEDATMIVPVVMKMIEMMETMKVPHNHPGTVEIAEVVAAEDRVIHLIAIVAAVATARPPLAADTQRRRNR